MTPMLAVARVELTRLLRARTALTLLVVVPLMQLILFGYAIRPVATGGRVAVAAADALGGKAVLSALAATPALQAPTAALRAGEAERAVRDGRALVGIEVPLLRGPAHPLAPDRPLRVVVDGLDPGAALVAEQAVTAAYWRALAGRTGPGLAITRLHNPQGRADWRFLPALAGVVTMISMLMLGSLSVAREREEGTWEMLAALPLSAAAALGGKLLPYVALGTAQGAAVLALGAVLFGLPVRGSPAALVTLLPLFAAAHLALGAAIAVRARAQLDALQGAVGFYLPAMLLSGFLYPFETLPRWAQALGEIFPLTHFIRAARGATLVGEPAIATLAHGWPIALFLAVALALAAAARPRRIA